MQEIPGSAARATRTTLAVIVLMASLAMLSRAALADDETTYTVRARDTLTHIARKNNITVTAFVAADRATYPCLATNPACLRTGWVIVIQVGSGLPAPMAKPSPAPAVTVNGLRQAIVDGLNRERALRGLALLADHEALTDIAQWRSDDIAARDYFDHADAARGEMLFVSRTQGAGLTYDAGVLHASVLDDRSRLVEQNVDGWLSRPPHRDLVVSLAYAFVGVGQARGRAGGYAWDVTAVLAE